MDLRQYRPKLLCPAAPIIDVVRLDTVVVADVHGQPHRIYRTDLFGDGPGPVPGDWVLFLPQLDGEPKAEIISAGDFADWEPIAGATLS